MADDSNTSAGHFLYLVGLSKKGKSESTLGMSAGLAKTYAEVVKFVKTAKE